MRERLHDKHHHLDKRARSIAEASEGPRDQLIDTKTLADWLGMSIQWCEIARRDGYGPPFQRFGHSVRYRRDAVIQWLEERERR